MTIESEMLPDNPAARLQSLLNRMLEVEFTHNEQISSVFARVLDIENDPSEVLPYYSQLFILIEDAYNKVMQYYPRQDRTHSTWRKYLTETFQQHSPYHHQWVALTSAIKKGTHLDIIQVANDNLEHFVRPTQVHGLTIEDLEHQVSQLVVEIKNSNELSEYLKVFLKEELEKILDYIKHFDLYGSDPIRKSIYNIIGNTEVSKNFACKAIAGVSALLVAVATSIGVVNDIASAPESIEKLKNEFYLPYVDQSVNLPSRSDTVSELPLKE
ncbi:hypothetical protein OPW33_24940 [Vibrio europaeus]|uniref:hypothetical protein n=1 Tax=Vibrio europaeus TaxID=300876 RepID=UPI0023424CCD|nr:hypothetical protein [Vibrio europaeus]MDC5842553.1 hypothetical protein [Vibrio europaeus]